MHRHGYKGRKFKREAGHRDLMLRNLATSVLLHERVKTTLEKAKEIRPVVEKLITKARVDDFNTRRTMNAYLLDKNATEKTIRELAPLYKSRNGGYTRIVKIGVRPGDGAEMAYIELLDTEKLSKKEDKKAAKAEKAPVTEVKETKKPARKSKAAATKKENK